MHGCTSRLRLNLIAALVFILGNGTSTATYGWGVTGHGAVGVLAVEQTTESARIALTELLGSTDNDVIVPACYWSDIYRDMGDGSDMFRLHFVNIDPDAVSYKGSRDCPDGQCVTAAVNHYAARLGDTSLSKSDRRLAFNHLCHFVGDLHQPLHVGYADDEGGNKVTVRYRGQEIKLHGYWDYGLIKQQVGSLDELLVRLRDRRHQAPQTWSPLDTYAWANESYSLMKNFAYPRSRTIDKAFEQRSWQVTEQQLDVAAARLAVILDWVLGGTLPSSDAMGDVEPVAGESG